MNLCFKSGFCLFSLLTIPAIYISAQTPLASEAIRRKESGKPLKLQYDTPAPLTRQGWENFALPIGNGDMGAMIFGGTDTERIQLNEKSLWTNGPGGITEKKALERDPDFDIYGNTDAYRSGAMDRYVEQCFKDYYSGRYTFPPPTSGPMKIHPSHRLGLGTFTNFAELYLDLGHRKVSAYRRELDLRAGLHTVSYLSGGVRYTRRNFASYPDRVIVCQISADRPGAVSVRIRPEIPFNNTRGHFTSGDRGNDGRIGAVRAEAGRNALVLEGTMDSGLRFTGIFDVRHRGGKAIADNSNPQKGTIEVRNADTVTVVLTLSTNYRNAFPDYRQPSPDYSRNLAEARIAAAAKYDFDALYRRHYADYSRIFNRVEFSIGGNYGKDEPTDILLKRWRKGKRNSYLEELYFQFCRYLLLSSSREDSLPANLQGVWNCDLRAPWQGDYHMNINLQMNYWPAYTANLPECGLALLNYVDSLQKPGALTAKKLYGVENTWMVNCSANAMGFTGNINSPVSLVSTASAFILQNIFDAYEFTRDKELLRSRIYPMMKSACNLFLERLRPGRTDTDRDRLFWVPSFSSEQGMWTVGATFDQQLIYLLFADTVTAAEELGVDLPLRTRLKEVMARLHPIEIGLSGQIKEYRQEGRYLNDMHTHRRIPRTDPAHRHNSMMMAMMPGDLITTETPRYMEAAKVSLNLRGDGATGWSMGQKLVMWARVRDGNRAYNKLFSNLMRRGTYPNLLDRCPPFQIDGNFGGLAGMIELLLQSHAGYIDILPALPDAWSDGSVEGILAEGNFEVSMEWKGKRPVTLRILSNSGSFLKIKAGRVRTVSDITSGHPVTDITHQEDGSIGFSTRRGHAYSLTFGKKDLSPLQAHAGKYRDYTPYAYTGDRNSFERSLRTLQRVASGGNCYLPTVATLPGKVDRAFSNLKRRGKEYGEIILALALRDRLEERGVPAPLQDRYRVSVTPVFRETLAVLEKGGPRHKLQEQGLRLVRSLDAYGGWSHREPLFTLIGDLSPHAAENPVLLEALEEAESLILRTDATETDLLEGVRTLRKRGGKPRSPSSRSGYRVRPETGLNPALGEDGQG